MPPRERESNPTKPGSVRAGVPDLVRDILDRKVRLASIEAEAVRPQVEIGSDLIELKKRAGRTWVSLVQGLGYSTRAAGRLRRLGARWRHGDIVTAGSEFASRLPSDPRKLAWLCRLSPDQLRALTTDLDCRAATHKEVVDAVRAILGKPRKARPKPTGMHSARKAIAMLLAALDNPDTDLGASEELRGLRVTIDVAVKMLQFALAAAEATAEPEPWPEAAEAS